MATILAHITVRPGAEARFEEVARKLYEATHAEEPNVTRYEYWRGATERTYYTLLSFPAFVDFLTHQTSDHHESASPALGELIEALRLEWVDPIEGASPLTQTAQQALPDGASELMQQYAVRFAPQIAEWWELSRAR